MPPKQQHMLRSVTTKTHFMTVQDFINYMIGVGGYQHSEIHQMWDRLDKHVDKAGVVRGAVQMPPLFEFELRIEG